MLPEPPQSSTERRADTMSISAIESVLQQMRATAVQSGIPSPIGSAGPAVEHGGFAAELKRSIDNISVSRCIYVFSGPFVEKTSASSTSAGDDGVCLRWELRLHSGLGPPVPQPK